MSQIVPPLGVVEEDAAAARVRAMIEQHVRRVTEQREDGLGYLAARCLEMWGCRPDEMELVEETRDGATHWHFRQRPGQPLRETE